MRTFRHIYNEVKKQPSPATKWVGEVAYLTKRSEHSVRMWIAGSQEPDDLCKSILSNYFGIPAEELFPTTKNATL
jgi:hypothetical protein